MPRFPVSVKEHRELLIAEETCPECGGELDTGWECNKCGFDAQPEASKIGIDSYRKD